MDQIESVLQRPLLYNNVDGVGEFGFGVFCLGCGLLDWLQASHPANSIWHGWVGMMWFWLLIAAIHYGSKAIKKNITYPRTGYVQYRARKSAWLYGLVLGCITALVAAYCLRWAARSHWDISGPHWGLTTPAALVGLIFAAVYAYKIAREIRWKWAVVSAIAISSIVISVIPKGMFGSSAVDRLPVNYGAWTLSLVAYGAILLLSGAISFALYVRHTQPPAGTAE